MKKIVADSSVMVKWVSKDTRGQGNTLRGI